MDSKLIDLQLETNCLETYKLQLLSSSWIILDQNHLQDISSFDYSFDVKFPISIKYDEFVSECKIISLISYNRYNKTFKVYWKDTPCIFKVFCLCMKDIILESENEISISLELSESEYFPNCTLVGTDKEHGLLMNYCGEDLHTTMRSVKGNIEFIREMIQFVCFALI